MSTFRRYPGTPFNWKGVVTPAIKWLILACSVVFLVQTVAALIGGRDAARWIVEWFGLIPLLATGGLRVWQPLTYLFLHGGLLHVLMNMLVLWMFGCDVERVWGRQRFLTYYFLCGVGAGLCVMAVNLFPLLLGRPALEGATGATIGASGAIFGVLLAAAILFPDRQVWLIPFPVMLPMRVFVLIMGAIEFFSSLEAAGSNVSHLAHLGGMGVGYFYLRRGSFFYSMRNQLTDWKQRRLRKKFDVYVREHKNEPPSRPDRWVH
jgi:membrane associated rhomboid family serine protease